MTLDDWKTGGTDLPKPTTADELYGCPDCFDTGVVPANTEVPATWGSDPKDVEGVRPFGKRQDGKPKFYRARYVKPCSGCEEGQRQKQHWGRKKDDTPKRRRNRRLGWEDASR